MASDPLHLTPASVGLPAGARVRARLLGYDGRYDDGSERAIDRGDLPRDTYVEGFLAYVHVATFDRWNFTVAGQPVDATTIVAVTT